MSRRKNFLGFTPSESITVGVIVLVLGLVVLLVMDPGAKGVQERNDRRREDVEQINKAVSDFVDSIVADGEEVEDSSTDVNDELFEKLSMVLVGLDNDSSSLQMITTGKTEDACELNCGNRQIKNHKCVVDLSGLEGVQLHQIPVDSSYSEPITGYYINVIGTTVTVGACTVEEEFGGLQEIKVSKSVKK